MIWLLLMLALSPSDRAGVAGYFESKAACESVALALFPDRPWACRPVRQVSQVG